MIRESFGAGPTAISTTEDKSTTHEVHGVYLFTSNTASRSACGANLVFHDLNFDSLVQEMDNNASKVVVRTLGVSGMSPRSRHDVP